jgi:hypothetical protein
MIAQQQKTTTIKNKRRIRTREKERKKEKVYKLIEMDGLIDL